MRKAVFCALSAAIMLACLSSCAKSTEYDDRKIASIQYFTTQSFIAITNEKKIDFETMNYYTNLFIEDIDSVRDMLSNPEEYEKGYQPVTTFTETEADTFLENIKKHGIFHLEEKYWMENIYDGEGWSLVITFADGSEFQSCGYMKSPKQAKRLNRDAQEFLGVDLFNVYR